MVKSYDRYEFEDCFGIVNSRMSNCVFLNYNHILSGHDECVSLWNTHEKEIKKKLTVPFIAPYYFFCYHVTYICINEKNRNLVAVGYINGCIKLFDIEENKVLSTFCGHTSAICKLKFNQDGNYLCSCGKDTNIILWDIINDQGMFKLEGHTNIVNDIEFLKMKNNFVDDFISNNLLISASKDCLIKVWELNIQLCVQTVVDCEEEITSILINETNTRLIAACNSFIKIYKIDLHKNVNDKFASSSKVYVSFLASIKRPNNCRIQNMQMIFLIRNENYIDSNHNVEDDDQLLYEDNYRDSTNLGNGVDEEAKDDDYNNIVSMNSTKGENENELNRFDENNERATNQNDGYKINSIKEPCYKHILNIIKNSLNKSVKLCNRSRYCAEGDNNGILLCCTNLKKIELYKINSIKNQKKSEKNKKKRIIEKLKKKKKAILKEIKRIEHFKGTQNIDFINLTEKLKNLQQNIDIHNKYHIHTANDEVKYLFHYNCKFRLQYLDVYRRRKRDSYLYLLVSYVTNRLNVFKMNLFDVLNNRDQFIVKTMDQAEQGGKNQNGDKENDEERSDEERSDEGRSDEENSDEEKSDEENDEKNSDEENDEKNSDEENDEKNSDEENDEKNSDEENDEKNSDEENNDERKSEEENSDQKGNRLRLETAKIVEKKIYDYSKCFKDICEINKGHNSMVHFLNLSENNELLISLCKKYVKVWNMRTFQNIITINLEGCTNAMFFQNDEYVIISDDTGYIYLYELRNIELKQLYKAHASGIINMCKNSKKNGFLSVGEENYMKLFELYWGERNEDQSEGGNDEFNDEYDDELVDEMNDDQLGQAEESKKKRRIINHKEEVYEEKKKTQLMLKELDSYSLCDKASCAIFSPNGKYICIGYLNNLIEVLYSDTLKLHLTLYGHSLPITCMDISKDNSILASGSSDKFLLLWNIEYGSINKRLHTNCDVLTKVQFFHENNNLISLSRDGLIKMWDAIKFQCICTMDGNFGVLTSVVINSADDYFLTSGSHRSIRCWKRRDDDLIFLEEERDKEMNLQIEKEVVRNDLSYPSSVEKNVLLNKATIKTIETIKSSEKLIEYLDIIDEELTLIDIYYKNLTAYEEAKKNNELPEFVQPPNRVKPRPELLNKNPFEFIIEVMCHIKKNILNEVLISLPFSYAYKLLNYIKTYLTAFYFFQRIQNNYGKFKTCGDFNFHVEYSINIVLSIINIYRNQFLFDTKFRFLLYELHQLIIPHLKKSLDQCSFNQSTLTFLLNSMDDDELDDE
ncbi:WD domain, G-beta repeat domain containing protein [Plasmodium gonderi]|uniref:WD domain, G-beta repeat domain containing protein n=1 Tax=Plasmodium gonderi TaxID=77519 RepID=A0A1Y1JMZ8_PLAGO|nr:WD domain, G-beta repeat domain containing protein [Plasmodium gonderi]GAW82607.1 WD domain, G-beta repeat domain containing protein [Plasmodium gonderi]